MGSNMHPVVAKKYDSVVLKDANGSVWVGNVVTHLTITEWADLHNYKVVEVSGFCLSLPHERTELSPPLRKRSGVFAIPSLIKRVLSHKG